MLFSDISGNMIVLWEEALTLSPIETNMFMNIITQNTYQYSCVNWFHFCHIMLCEICTKFV